MAEESFAAGLVGVVLDDRYRLDALLGEGGMGAVFRAHHLAMDRKVAVKLLKPHLTTDEAALQRFAREARATMRVESDHAVKVLDFGVTPHKDYYMVLEYLDGRTVQRELDVDGPFDPGRVVHIAKQACAALGAAHRSGLIHRDVKPDNLLLMRSGDDPDFVKVLDFGVAKLMEGAARSDRSMLAITQAGMVFGTPEFMSPEQACGQQLDGRSDLYSLAATMFAMLTGCGMYRAKSAIEWLTHHARTPAPHLADGAPSLAQYTELDAVLQRCLAKQRDARPQTAEQMAQMLASVEHSLGKVRAPLPEMRGPVFSPSTYVTALDPNATLLPQQVSPKASAAAATMKPGDGMMMPGQSIKIGTLPPSGTDAIEMPQPKRRGMWLVVGAVIVAGMIAAAIVVAMKKRSPTTPSPVAKAADKPVDAEIADAAVADAPAIAVDAAVPVDAGVQITRKGSNPEIAKLIAEAEEAKRGRKLVRWVQKADAALQLDSRNVKARFLLAEGLIASGDLDRGCKYLRELGRNPTAKKLATQAGCPAD